VAAGLWCLITYPFFVAMAVGEKRLFWIFGG